MMQLRKGLVEVMTEIASAEPGSWFLRDEDRKHFVYLLCYRFNVRENIFALKYSLDGALIGSTSFNIGSIAVIGTYLFDVWEAPERYGLNPEFQKMLDEYATLLQKQQRERELLLEDISHIEAAQGSQLGISIANDDDAGLYFFHLPSRKYLFWFEGRFSSVERPIGVQWRSAKSPLWHAKVLAFLDGGRGGYINRHGVRVPNPCGETDLKGRDLDKFSRNVRPGDKWDDATIDRVLADPESV